MLHWQLQDCIELLLQHRLNTKIKSENPYLFGIPGYDKHRYKHLRACDLIRDFSSKCGAAKPFTLRGTKLRKHIATKCITLNLSESEVTQLANFMGHDISIHKSHYQQSIPEIDIPRFSRLLNVAIFNEEKDDNDDDDDEVENKRDENLISENSVNLSENSSFTDIQTKKNVISKIPSSKALKRKSRSSEYTFY